MPETPDAVAEGRRAEAVPEPALVVLALGERQRLGGAVSEADATSQVSPSGMRTVRPRWLPSAGRLLHATTVHSGDVSCDVEAQPREKAENAPFRW